MGPWTASEGRGEGDGAVRKVISPSTMKKAAPTPLAGSGNLVDAGYIAPGTVSAKSILDLKGRELAGFRQAHFFAGIGVWSAALRAAGWPDSRRVWTGSCPCQPFSAAGKGGGFADERHLWPAWFWLIEQHRPDVLFGEQVEGPAGRAWLDLVFTDLEAIGYACGAVVFPAAGVGALHLRHRTYWVASQLGNASATGLSLRQRAALEGQRWRIEGRATGQSGRASDGLADAGQRGRPVERPTWVHDRGQFGDDDARRGASGSRGAYEQSTTSPVNGFWRDPDWIFCRDNKWRPVEPGSFPLAHGAPARVGRLRAHGNAIVLQQAQAFIESFLDIEGSIA